ncbi:uncharacterized protein [Anoplolepis gracilipes]|uniref:uncharacterized protein n=1 Tax=Anoplolepis gracilipes TaxID=354296 RepID=UPI003B9DD07E
MMFHVLTALNIATSVLCATRKDTLPVNLCKRNSTDYSACLKKTLEKLWPQFVEGFPEIGFPPLDPFFFDYGNGTFNRGEIYGEVIIFNTTIIGFRETRFLSLKSYINGNKYRFEGDVEMPKLVLNGSANAVGSLGGIRMGGKGHFKAIAENVRTAYYVTGHAENNILVLEHVRVIPVIEKLKVYFYDFFEGNKEFNDLLEMFVNEFWPSLYRILMPIASDVGDTWLTNFANSHLSKVPISRIYP